MARNGLILFVVVLLIFFIITTFHPIEFQLITITGMLLGLVLGVIHNGFF